jgi:hypothetical protein
MPFLAVAATMMVRSGRGIAGSSVGAVVGAVVIISQGIEKLELL